MSSHCTAPSCAKKEGLPPRSGISIALAGNANVGKSTLFNLLSGSSQHVANWPGKTVEIAYGTLLYRGMKMEVADLPGSYSFSAHSPEEEIARRFIVEKKPSVVVDVIDVCSLERNLFFALELCELGAPLVLALNQCDLEKEKGLQTDEKALGRLLRIPVVKVSAASGFGVRKLADECIAASLSRRRGSTKKIQETDSALPSGPLADASASRSGSPPVFASAFASQKRIRYSPKAEREISRLELQLGQLSLPYPKRYAAIKLLEGDRAIAAEVEAQLSGKLKFRKIDIIAEKYRLASRIASRVQKKGKARVSLIDRLDRFTTHRIFGYAIMFLLLSMIFYLIFAFGNLSSSLIGDALNSLRPPAPDTAAGLLFEMVAGGLVAGITLVLPYVLPFYLLLSILEDTGYITRMAFLLEGFSHRLGLHGKALFPLMLGYGCNVPAVFGSKILESRRDRLITSFAATLVPCTARTVVIFALVGTFLGAEWALALYAFNIIAVALLSKLAYFFVPGQPAGMIMEMPPYRIPSPAVVLRRTWNRIRSLLTVVFPYYVGGGLLFALFYLSGATAPLDAFFAPLTQGWLGLPSFAATLLLFGLVRKELIVVLPAVLLPGAAISALLSPLQMVVLTVVAIFYTPCIATMEALKRELGAPCALAIVLFDTALALFLGGIALRLLAPFF